MNRDDKRCSMKRKYVEDECGICLGSPKSVIGLFPCLHEFCLSCACNWLIIRLQCPLCKQPCNAILKIISENQFNDKIQIKLKDLQTAWKKRSLIDNFFNIRRKNIKLMQKQLYKALKVSKFQVEVTRRWMYMCNLKTVVYKRYLNSDNNDDNNKDYETQTIDPGHKVWQWLAVELEIFYSLTAIRKFIKFAKEAVSSLIQLIDLISNMLTDIVLPTFLHEMKAFLSCYFSCEGYYTESNIKMVTCRLPGDSLDSIIIKYKDVSLSLLSKLIVRSIFHLEHENSNQRVDLSTFKEISHIDNLIKLSTSSEPQEFMIVVQEFIKIRLQRIGKLSSSSSSRSLLDYHDYFKLPPQYLLIYTDCLLDNKEKKGDCAAEMDIGECVDLTKEEQHSVIDLTEEDS